MTWCLTNFLHAPQLLTTWSIFFGCGILVYANYALRHRQGFAWRDLVEHCVPIDVFTDESFHMDVKIYLLGKLTFSVIILPALLLNAYAITTISAGLRWVAPGWTRMTFDVGWAFACTLAMVVVTEFAEFICHYAEHKVPALWELHKVHHSASSLNPLTSKRTHPLAFALEEVVSSLLTALPGGAYVFLFDITTAEAMALCVVASRMLGIVSLAPLRHSQHKIGLGLLDRVLISPHMHQIHHSSEKRHWDRNFGTNLSVFDWIFGTGYKPQAGESVTYGISGCGGAAARRFHTMHGAYVQPVVSAYRRLMPSRPAAPTQPGLPVGLAEHPPVLAIMPLAQGGGLDLAAPQMVAQDHC